jgi:aminoglycoside phosphotransferase (APT) family kinase protein
MDAERTAIVRGLAEKIVEIGTPDFVRRHLCGFVPECRGEEITPEDIEINTIQNDGTGAATVELRIRGSAGLFVKLYPDESGVHAYQVLTALWKNGFGPGQRYQVPEPLCFIGAYNLLVTRKAPGECLESMLARDDGAAMEGVKEAARWLLRLHGSSVRAGSGDHAWYVFRKLAGRLSRASATHPGEAQGLVAMLERLAAAEGAAAAGDVQVHGQFRPIHVFLGDEAVCVIDLDRSQPSCDPSQDLGEFVHRLRTTVYRRHDRLDRADLLTTAFLGEYGAKNPAALCRAPFYRGFRVMDSFCNHLKKLKAGDPAWEKTIQFYTGEFETALSGEPGTGRGDAPSPLPVPGEGEFLSRVEEMTGPEFVETVVRPAVFGTSRDGAYSRPVEASVAQEDRGTGRVTIQYRFGRDTRVFGKFSPSPEPHPFQVMETLRGGGFAEGPYRVAEPLAYLPERNFLLVRCAPGVPLVDSIGAERPAFVEDVRRAARWLSHLHASPLRIGPPDTVWRSMRLFSVILRLTTAAAKMPRERDWLMKKIDRLCAKAREGRECPPVVQAHGSFYLEHIFVTEETVTVIDFDKSFPSDPARDLAEFLAMLRRRTFKQTGSLDAARAPTRAFLVEYASRLPANIRNLALYWGAAVLLDLIHYKKRESRDERTRGLALFFAEEYDRVLSGELIRDALGTDERGA